MQSVADAVRKISSAKFLSGFFRLIAVQIGASLLRIASLARDKWISAPTLVKSTNLLDFCTCFHRLNGRNVSFN
jgi:hypothetical protein